MSAYRLEYQTKTSKNQVYWMVFRPIFMTWLEFRHPITGHMFTTKIFGQPRIQIVTIYFCFSKINLFCLKIFRWLLTGRMRDDDVYETGKTVQTEKLFKLFKQNN